MMKFNIGETVIEPTNGICEMEGMRRMKIDGVEMTVYIFKAQSAKVYVPADQIENRNIRRPMSREDVKKVLASLKQPVSPNREDARMQYTHYREIMKSGDPMKIARLLRDLFILDASGDLKGKEKEIMEQTKKFLIDEIAFIRQVSKGQVQEQIMESLRAMMKKKIAKDKERVKKSGTSVPMGILGYEEDEPYQDDGDDATEEEDVFVAKPAKKGAKPVAAFEDEDEEEEGSLGWDDEDEEEEEEEDDRV
jgi:CarD family transcriptional regulator